MRDEKELNNWKSMYGFDNDQMKVIRFLYDIIDKLDDRVRELEYKFEDLTRRPETSYEY